MKISASIYSNKGQGILETIKDLNDSHVDMIHVDCKDDLNVFFDIEKIQENSTIPIDLHIITTNPERFYPTLLNFDIDYVTFQYEDLESKSLNIPKEYTGEIGLAITSDTPISIFEEYKDAVDFILFMATVPGESGGKFDSKNFRKIREFQKAYPDKRVHVDGGVNAEVSFILRNMGVYASVSGSYLFNSTNIDQALLNLKLQEVESHFLVSDFMRDISESPHIKETDLTLENVLTSMNEGGLGFTMVLGENNHLKGIIGNADLRKGLLTHINDLNSLNMNEIINPNPLLVQGNYSVYQLLRFIKKESRTIMYLPVTNENGQAIGSINFMNLIKGEL